jgi:hypothetical protein
MLVQYNIKVKHVCQEYNTLVLLDGLDAERAVAVLGKEAQIGLADAANGVDVSTAAVVLGQVAAQPGYEIIGVN